MYLRPDEVIKVLEKVGFECVSILPKAQEFRRDEHYVYVNREGKMGRTALIIHPELAERSKHFAEPAELDKHCEDYLAFPKMEGNPRQYRHGIAYGFCSRLSLERFLFSVYGM